MNIVSATDLLSLDLWHDSPLESLEILEVLAKIFQEELELHVLQVVVVVWIIRLEKNANFVWNDEIFLTPLQKKKISLYEVDAKTITWLVAVISYWTRVLILLYRDVQ